MAGRQGHSGASGALQSAWVVWGVVALCPPWRMGSWSLSCPHLTPGCVALPELTFSSACPCEVASGSPFPRVPQIHPPGVSPAFRFPRAGWTHTTSLPRFPAAWPPEGALFEHKHPDPRATSSPGAQPGPSCLQENSQLVGARPPCHSQLWLCTFISRGRAPRHQPRGSPGPGCTQLRRGTRGRACILQQHLAPGARPVRWVLGPRRGQLAGQFHKMQPLPTPSWLQALDVSKPKTSHRNPGVMAGCDGSCL